MAVKSTAEPKRKASTTSPQAPALLRRRVRNKAAKRYCLLNAASKLFATKGYDLTTTREIATSAGCAEGLIHRYFGGKAGLLPALIEQRMSKEVTDMSALLPLAPTFENEFLQLVDWEVDHMWDDRDFLRVVIPRALLDEEVSKTLNRVRTSTRTDNIAHRLKHYRECAPLPKVELEALAAFVGSIGLVCGFMRPTILGQSRRQAKNFAINLAKLLVRGVQTRRSPN
jgi:AcrR family transcriptional regulator